MGLQFLFVRNSAINSLLIWPPYDFHLLSAKFKEEQYGLSHLLLCHHNSSLIAKYESRHENKQILMPTHLYSVFKPKFQTQACERKPKRDKMITRGWWDEGKGGLQALPKQAMHGSLSSAAMLAAPLRGWFSRMHGSSRQGREKVSCRQAMACWAWADGSCFDTAKISSGSGPPVDGRLLVIVHLDILVS